MARQTENIRELTTQEAAFVSGAQSPPSAGEYALAYGYEIGRSQQFAFGSASVLSKTLLTDVAGVSSLTATAAAGLAAAEATAAVMQYGETGSDVQYVLNNIHNDPAPPAADSSASYATIDGHYFDTNLPGNQELTLNTTADGVTYLSNTQGDQVGIAHTPDTTVSAAQNQIPTESATLDMTLNPVMAASDADDPIPTEPASAPDAITQSDSGFGGGGEIYWSSHGDYMDGCFDNG